MAKVGIKEVARVSGVAISTVSMALNGSGQVNEDTRLRIKAVAAKLGYVPNPIAQKLVSGKSKTIGIIAPLIRGISYFPEFCEGVEEVASKRGFRIITCNSDMEGGGIFANLQLLMDFQVDGVIANMPLLGLEKEYLKILHGMIDKDIKIVSSSPELNKLEIDTVIYNAHKGAELAVKHLIECGRKNIAFIMGGGRTGYNLQKELAYKEALLENGIAYRPSLTEIEDASVEGGYRAMKKLLDSAKKVNAVFAATDLMAIGAMKAIIEAGLKIPEDVAVAGFDNMKAVIPFAPVPLTTVEPAKHEMGKKLCAMLIERIENTNGEISARRIILEPELIVRESTTGKNSI